MLHVQIHNQSQIQKTPGTRTHASGWMWKHELQYPFGLNLFCSNSSHPHSAQSCVSTFSFAPLPRSPNGLAPLSTLPSEPTLRLRIVCPGATAPAPPPTPPVDLRDGGGGG